MREKGVNNKKILDEVSLTLHLIKYINAFEKNYVISISQTTRIFH